MVVLLFRKLNVMIEAVERGGYVFGVTQFRDTKVTEMISLATVSVTQLDVTMSCTIKGGGPRTGPFGGACHE
jgi:hypothetical protein